MSKIPDDLAFGRETWVKVPKTRKSEPKTAYAVCIKTDDETLLIPSKVYKVKLGGDRVCVVDEEGEVAVYPKDFFLVLSLSPVAESALSKLFNKKSKRSAKRLRELVIQS